MRQKTTALFLGLFLAITASAAAEALSEQSLSQANFQGLTVEGANKQECESASFLKNSFIEQQGVFTIFSIHAEFLPVNEGEAGISAFINDSEEALAELKPKDFKNNWARVQIPKENLSEKNTLKVCAKTSNSITTVKVLEDSKIGYYKMPVLTVEKTVSDSRPIVGKEVKVTVKAKNIGSAEAKASVKYWSIEEEIAQITKGDVEFEGIIKPGEAVELNYYVKPKYALQMDLASAWADFENVFGETERVYSNRPTLYVQEPEFKIMAFLSTQEQTALKPGEQAEITLTLRNQAQAAIENVSISFQAPESVILSKEKIEGLNFQAGETKTINLSATSLFGEGSFQIGCKVAYNDPALASSECNKLVLEFEKPKASQAFVAALALVVIGAIVYAFVYKPERKRAG
ncbi:MAG: hypothetical protein J4478_03090 [Candidatus Diapherotrites archaeon]|uniref:CARDB domain-containing protein n=1 Tax=Candidatus Iainarchaeum sp. TaxID=3101447 RepID=A0A7J4KX53_9ARCH|nr:hypothetical protein [Candidatus Diapherotrites archaeon]HIH33015.1 hypothetical protein [Candidatus Diapherotrites archaeon]